jgi:hypothetical protein
MRTRLGLALAVAVAALSLGVRTVRATPFSRPAAQQTVEQFYTDLRAGAYSDAYSFFTARFAVQNPYAQWVSGYATTLLFAWSSWSTNDPAVVGVHLSAEDSVLGHQEFEGQWRLVRAAASPSGWLLDDASLQPSGLYPTSVDDVDTFAPFAGGWERHGFAMGVSPGGHALLDFRIYSWCGGDPTPPCDMIVGDNIYGGGHGGITFTSVVENTAYGVFDDGGAVSMTLLPYDMATLNDPDDQLTIVLCGANYSSLAPPDLIASGPCGA